MKSKLNFILITITFIFLTGLRVLSQTVDNSEETKLKKFEIGGHFTIMFQDDYETADVVFKRYDFKERVITDRRYESGFGGRFTYNINRNLAVEGEINFTPSTPTKNERAIRGEPTGGYFPGGKKTQFLGGLKYGIRRSKYGLFVKARPGVIRFTAFPKIVGQFLVPSPTGGQPLDILLFQAEAPANFFNLDAGGVVEYYPSRRTLFRVDVGDTIIRYGAQKPKDINPSFTRHNLQINVGFGFRF